MYITSPGGSVAAGLKVYDTVRMLAKAGIKVNTYAMGYVASMGSFLAATGTGTRYLMPNAQHMIHQCLGGSKGQETEMRGSYEGILDCRMKLNYGYVVSCHARSAYKDDSVEEFFNRLWCETERDNWLASGRCVELGLVDEVLMPDEELIVPDSILNDKRYPQLYTPPRYNK
jgi:ATP-dependent Clp protease protease subunit